MCTRSFLDVRKPGFRRSFKADNPSAFRATAANPWTIASVRRRNLA